jgi:ABC-2 type transport system ATP-binding protein
MTESIIEADGLRKAFRAQPALDGLDLRVPPGTIFGFLGKNGAGKTTTIKILMDILRPDGGAVRVFGMPLSDPSNAVAVRRRIGLVTEDKELYPYMTVEQVIKFTRSFFPNWRRDLESRYLRMFELPLNRKIDALSKGMRSKLMLLLAICHGAELLILDEPTDGLDPTAIDDVLRELVSIAGSDGTTIFFSSHQLAEVEQIAEHICIIDRGRAVVAGSLDDLKAHYQRIQIVMDRELAPSVRWVDGVERVRQEGRTISILASRNIEAILEQARSLHAASTERFPVTLKEIFFEHVRTN